MTSPQYLATFLSPRRQGGGDALDSLFKALSLRRQKNYTEAQKLYKKLLTAERTSQTALTELADMFTETKDDAILEYFKSLRSGASSYPFSDQNRALTLDLLASMCAQAGEFSSARQLYDEVIAQYSGTPQERHARFEKFYLACHIDNDLKAATQILNEIQSKYSEGMDLEFAQYLLRTSNESSSSSSALKKSTQTMSKKSESKIGIPTEFQLSVNYPNPFNPSTTIQFALPTGNFVTLKVFDVLGKEVATLANEERPAGFHEVRFDASKLSSGIYIYQIQAGMFRDVKKMLLMK